MSKFPGGHRGRVTPVPIPNTEVKPATADGTACVGVWESRSLPGLLNENARRESFTSGVFLRTVYWTRPMANSLSASQAGTISPSEAYQARPTALPDDCGRRPTDI